MMVGIIGAALGSLAGCGFLLKINAMENWLFLHFGWQLWDRTVYAIGDIPNDIEWKILTGIILSTLIACLAGAIIPTCQAARLQPAESLQVSQL